MSKRDIAAWAFIAAGAGFLAGSIFGRYRTMKAVGGPEEFIRLLDERRKKEA